MIGKQTGGNLLTSCSEHVDGVLEVANAGGEVCAALERLDLFTQVVHGGGDGCSPQRAAMGESA